MNGYIGGLSVEVIARGAVKGWMNIMLVPS
jgi:hypothetical protein